MKRVKNNIPGPGVQHACIVCKKQNTCNNENQNIFPLDCAENECLEFILN